MVQLLVVERLQQLQRDPARLGETLRDRILGALRHLGGDPKTLARSAYAHVKRQFGELHQLLDLLDREVDAVRRGGRVRGRGDRWEERAGRGRGVWAGGGDGADASRGWRHGDDR